VRAAGQPRGGPAMPSPAPPHRSLPPVARVAVAVYVAVWLAALAGPPAAMLRWREARLARLAEPAAQADWDAFRADMRRQSGGAGPVQRKVPRSAEPPELVWLRDHAALAVTAWVGFVGVLGACLGILLAGGLRPRLASPAEDQPRRDRHDEKQHERDAEHAEEGKHRSPPR
jgi:hypothetical protein